MEPIHWLALIEPGLGRRDQQFFELAATLIPIFFLAGTIAGVAQSLKPRATPRHVILVLLLLLFLIIEIFAELLAIESLVSGVTRDFDRFFVLAALILGMWAAGFALVWPWVQQFFDSKRFRVGAFWIVGTMLAGMLLSGYGVFRVFEVVFEVTQEERTLQRVQNEEKKDLTEARRANQPYRGANDLLRLNIQFARICRVGAAQGWPPDQRLARRLVKFEIWEKVHQLELDRVLEPEQKDNLEWLEGSC